MTVARCRGRRPDRVADRSDFQHVPGQPVCCVQRDARGADAKSSAKRHVRRRGRHRRRSRVARVLLHRVRGATVAADLQPVRVLWRAGTCCRAPRVPLRRHAGGAGGSARLPRPASPLQRCPPPPSRWGVNQRSSVRRCGRAD